MAKDPTSIDALRSGVEAYRASLELARTELTSVRARIVELEREESELRAAPISKEDFLAGLCAWIDDRASVGVANIGATLSGVRARAGSSRMTFDADHFEWSCFRTGQTLRLHGTSLIAAADPRSFQGGFENLFNEVSLCLLFGEQIKDSMRKTLDMIEWPYVDATSIESRERRIQEIAAELQPLRAEAGELASILEFGNPPTPAPKQRSPEEVEADRREESARRNAWVDRQIGLDKPQSGLLTLR